MSYSLPPLETKPFDDPDRAGHCPHAEQTLAFGSVFTTAWRIARPIRGPDPTTRCCGVLQIEAGVAQGECNGDADWC